MSNSNEKSSNNQNEHIRRTNFFDVNRQKPQKMKSASSECVCYCPIVDCDCSNFSCNCPCNCVCWAPGSGQGIVYSGLHSFPSQATLEGSANGTSNSIFNGVSVSVAAGNAYNVYKGS